MAALNNRVHRTLVPIVPALAKPDGSADTTIQGTSTQSVVPHICKTCSKRKVKCDKITPTCSSCRKSKLECVYQQPQPRSRKRKRKLSEDDMEKLLRYEHILRQHGLLPEEILATVPRKPMVFSPSEPDMPKLGKLLTGEGKSRYVESITWQNLEEDEIQEMSDDEDESNPVSYHGIGLENFDLDPLSGALMNSHQDILDYHPKYEDAMVLWKAHIENVQPICRVLHIPSCTEMVESASRHPKSTSRADDCLLFAIYYTAAVSMTDGECTLKLGQPRSSLVSRYHFATRQALVNALFLKTTEMSVLQAFFLFLLACRTYYDSHTYWILTGIAVRIAQRMGLHRDGEKLGLPPFDAEMRRRLMIQLYPLDNRASQVCGTDITIMPETWDIQLPLNINDEQIWPGMTEKPVEQTGATDMMFCLSRACGGKTLARAGSSINGASPWGSNEYYEAELLITAAENEVEERFIRYCDIVNSLHFLVIGMARLRMTGLRLRIRLPKVRNQAASDMERVELFHLAQKNLDTDAAVHAHSGLSKYQWHLRSFLLWGIWDSLTFVLMTLWKRHDLLSLSESETAWKSVALTYEYHAELLESKKALHMAVGRLLLKAWDTHLLADGDAEPAFVVTLKLRQAPRISITSLPESIDSDLSRPFDVAAENWMFWDQLIKDYDGRH
ncbi:fungal-specific transcription factor domain-containing protein [Aspergillus crustosus]